MVHKQDSISSERLFLNTHNANGGLLFLLVFCSIWKPAVAWHGISIFMVVLTVVLISGVTMYRIHHGLGYKALWSEYKMELVLCVAYVLVCLLSLLLNMAAYVNFSEFIFYGLSPIVIWCMFPVSLLLFVLPPIKREGPLWLNGEWLGWLLLVILALIALWQAVDYMAAWQVSSHFVSVDIPSGNRVINSLLRTNTDFGPIMALSAISLLCVIKGRVGYSKWTLLIYCSIASLCVVAGILSASRNFLLTLFFGGAVFGFYFMKKKPMQTLLATLVILVVAHGVVLSHPHTTVRLGIMLPYIVKLANHEPMTMDDFIPNVAVSSLIERQKLWVKAVDMWQDKPILGVSAGAFKLSNNNGLRVHATHNLFIQVLVEAGVVGLVIMILLIGRLINRRVIGSQAAIFVAVLVNLQFDYYLDHSLPWILIVAWLFIRVKHARATFDDKLVV